MSKRKFVTIFKMIAIFCIIITLSNVGLWIHSASIGGTQQESHAIYNHYFPSYLRGRGIITTISVFLNLIGVILIMVVIHKSPNKNNVINFAFMALAMFLLALNLFWSM